MRTFLILSLILAGCANSPEILLPQTVGSWKQVSSEELYAPGDGATVHSYRYEGQSAVSVTTYQFKSETVTFEKFQQWKVQPDTLPFYKGRLLIVPAGEDRNVLRQFSEALQPLLK